VIFQLQTMDIDGKLYVTGHRLFSERGTPDPELYQVPKPPDIRYSVQGRPQYTVAVNDGGVEYALDPVLATQAAEDAEREAARVTEITAPETVALAIEALVALAEGDRTKIDELRMKIPAPIDRREL